MSINRRDALKTFALASAAAFAPTLPLIAAQDTEAPLTDPARPGFHYLPAHNWMNDPCGPIYFQGQYHLFHQYNPKGPLWGNMNWAHAVSPDMVHWQRLPVALSPTPGGPDSEGCFTGTAVLDHGRPTFLYTGVQSSPLAEATLADPKNPLRESQCLAVATDDTLTRWKKLPAPVIPLPPAGMKVTGFRDPSPWKDGDTWYTVVGSGVAKKGGMVLLYRSPDLRAWEYLHPLVEGRWTGKVTADTVDSGEMWECPDFFPLTDVLSKTEKHVLIHSSEGKVLWQSGTLDRGTMRFTAEKTGELDYGRAGTSRVTYYAPKTQLDGSGNRILWGWIGETRQDAECVRAGWSGLMSLPRVLTLHDGELHMQPAAQVARLRDSSAPSGQVHEFVATLEQTASASAPKTAPYEVRDPHGTILTVQSDREIDPRTLRFEFGNGIAPIIVPMPGPLGPRVQLHAFMDNSVLEIFVDDRFCVTHRFYGRNTGKPIATLSLAREYTVVRPQTFALRSIWPA